MVRYRKRIESGVVRVPKIIREAFGNEIVIAPNLSAAAVYSPKTKKTAVIRSLQVVIKDLRNEIILEKEETQTFYKSKVAAEIREEYTNKSNSVKSFFSKCLEFDRSSYEQKDDVYSAFIKFCSERKLPHVSKQRFGSLLSRYAQVREIKKGLSGKQIRCWQGVRLINSF